MCVLPGEQEKRASLPAPVSVGFSGTELGRGPARRRVGCGSRCPGRHPSHVSPSDLPCPRGRSGVGDLISGVPPCRPGGVGRVPRTVVEEWTPRVVRDLQSSGQVYIHTPGPRCRRGPGRTTETWGPSGEVPRPPSESGSRAGTGTPSIVPDLRPVVDSPVQRLLSTPPVPEKTSVLFNEATHFRVVGE